MKKVFYLLILIFANLNFAQLPKENLKGLDSEIEKIMTDYKAVGLSVAIVKNDKVIYSKGFGYRNLENKLPVTPQTIFGIGSNTKAFTAALIGILEKDDKLKLNEKPSKYIPHLEFSTDKMNNIITVEDLLDHRSGLGSLDGSYILFPAENRLQLLNKLPYLKQNAEPKDSWRYSNFGYIVLGAIIEQVSQKSWDDIIKEKLLNPLKMDNSNTSINEMLKQKDFSYPYGMYNGNPEKIQFQIPNNDKPGAAINSSANDMTNWLKMWLNYGKFDGIDILTKDFARNAMSARALINGNPPVEPEQKNYLFGYGYGWNTKIFKGHFKVDHGGSVSGFSSNVVLFPAENFGIVVLSNQQNSDLPYTIANMISIRMLGLDESKPYKYEKEVYDVYKPVAIKSINQQFKPTHTLDDYCGEYSNKGYGTIKITQEDGNLFAIFPTFKFVLEHQKYDSFVSRLINEVPQQMNPEFDFKFNLGYNGEVKELVMDLQGGIIFEKE
ncbi:serine hydrolase [Cloacibacterium sp.]|uniref:serine hydrolase n=1 Tax=Cloacibacterium sp. TaxID=1913682 RepID=UPI0039E61D3B